MTTLTPSSPSLRAMLTGAVVGVTVYVIAQALVPSDVPNTAEHDLALARRLGYVFAFAVAGWTALQQRSSHLALLGAFVAAVVGSAYSWLCETREFFSIMVAFPCLLGGVMAVFLPAKRNRGAGAAIARFVKGLCAGFILGVVYMFVLNVSGSFVSGPFLSREVGAYRTLMWKTGPIALGLASALFFPMFRWATGQVRIVLEEC